MSLTPEQQQAVSRWVAAGDNLSAVQKRLLEEFKVSMTYRDVRFLVDDLNLALKDAAPKIDASDVTKAPTAKPAAPGQAPGAVAAAGPEDEALEDLPEDLPPGAARVTVNVDKVTLMPGAIASGSVTFSDGVSAQWIVDNQGRPGFTKVSQPGYRPTPADGQAFVQELSAALQKRGY
ncbi:MAG: hypothetical protein NT173_07015 [Opitutales bacterium]|nr:hypothetical protein [Opitutales bacterium]